MDLDKELKDSRLILLVKHQLRESRDNKDVKINELVKPIISQTQALIDKAVIEAKIEQSWRCRELIEANRNNNEDGEYYGDIALLDVDDLQNELNELKGKK